MVELAAAFLVVNGVLSTIASIDVVGRIGDRTPGIEPLALLALAIGIATTALGVLVRFGHAWLVTVNVAAIAGFLELTSGTSAGLVTGLIDVTVVLALVWARPWFLWRADTVAPPDANDGGRGAGGAPEE